MLNTLFNPEGPVFPSLICPLLGNGLHRFSQQTPLLGEIVFSVIGGRYTGSVSQNKQLLYRGQSRVVRTEPAHMHITESKSNEDYTLLNNEDQRELLLIQYCAFIFHPFHSISHLCVRVPSFLCASSITLLDIQTTSRLQKLHPPPPLALRTHVSYLLHGGEKVIQWSDSIF